MAVPARPSPGAPVASDWGDVVHDAIVAMDTQAGVAEVVFTAGSAASGATAIVFPRPFAGIPVVVACMGGASAAGVNYAVGVANVTAAGCHVQAREVRENTTTTGPRPVQWIAYGPRA